MSIKFNKDTNHKGVGAKEDIISFIVDPTLPLCIAMTGITYPNKDYWIYREPGQTTVIEYILSGEGEVMIDGEMKKAVEGDSYLLMSGREHRYRANPLNPWKKVWINVECSFLNDMITAYGLKSDIYRVEIGDLLTQIYDIARDANGYREICFAAAERVYEIISRIALSIMPEDFSKESKIKDFLNGCIYKKINVDDAARFVNLSKSQTIRSFKAVYHITPYEYLLQQKLETAKSMLAGTTLSVKQIAAQVHIMDEHYFSHLFFKREGMRPNAYRRKYSVISF